MRTSFVRILTVVCMHRTARLLLAKEPFLSRGVSEKQPKGRGEKPEPSNWVESQGCPGV